MTKDNPVAAGAAELLPCPFCGGEARLLKGGPGNCFVRCDDCSAISDDGSEERAIEAWNRRAASPVQAGIDPLVAEIEAGLESLPASAWRTETAWPADYAGYVVCGFFGETPHMPRLPQAQAFVVTDDDFDDDLNVAMARHVARCSPYNIAKLIGGYRSQAERISTLEALEKDTSTKFFSEHEQRIAAESLLAEAREALSYSAMGLRRIHDALVRPGPKQAVGEMVEHFMTKADATLSRLKPGEKGGGE